jgi:GT2 family glycosyltransferase
MDQGNGSIASPPSLPESTLDPAAQRALQRVGELEEDVARHRRQLLAAYETLHDIYASSWWSLLTCCTLLRERLFPAKTRRRRVADRLFRTLVRWQRRLTLGSGTAAPPTIGETYPQWIVRNEPDAAGLVRQRQTRLAHRPCLSLLVPLAGAPGKLLRAALESVLGQTYPHWELCLAAGDPTAVEGLVPRALRDDPRLRLLPLPPGQGTAEALRTALAAATGEYVAVLEADDALAPFALFEVARALNDTPGADFLYSDEDRLDRRGRRRGPLFKPDWSPDTLRSHDYIGRLAVLRRALLDAVGGFRPGCWEYDLHLRASERAEKILHLPKVLYHRRDSNGPPADAAPVLAEHLRRLGADAEVHEGEAPGLYRVAWALPARPRVSILIPNRDQAELLAGCVESIRRSAYRNYEIVLVENNSRLPETRVCYQRLRRNGDVRLLTWEKPFNYAALNNFAAARACGDVLLFLNNDIRAINPDWLERMLEHALRPEIGAVGARLYYPDDTIQHAGIVLTERGPKHYQRGRPRSAPGYGDRLRVVQNLSAVTGACLMMRRTVFEEVGGFDEAFVVALNDVDLCLKVRRHGYLVVWTPHAELYHLEFATRGPDVTPQKQALLEYELALFRWRWGDLLERGDPYYSPNLTQVAEDCGLRLE